MLFEAHHSPTGAPAKLFEARRNQAEEILLAEESLREGGKGWEDCDDGERLVLEASHKRSADLNIGWLFSAVFADRLQLPPSHPHFTDLIHDSASRKRARQAAPAATKKRQKAASRSGEGGRMGEDDGGISPLHPQKRTNRSSIPSTS